MSLFERIGIGLLLLTQLVGCAGTETGNPGVDTASLTVVARSRDPQVVSFDTDQGRVRIEALWLTLGPAELARCGGGTVPVAPAWAVNLVGPSRSQEFEVPPSDYCGFSTAHARLNDALTDVPAELAMHSFWIAGRRGDGVDFRLRSDLVAPVQLSGSDTPFAVDAHRPLILAFDVARWFANVDLDAAVVTDGMIRVGDGQNAPQLTDFEGHVDNAASLHHDLDANGLLDPEELDPVAQ